ncbi:MAG: ATP-binding protein [Candidatus Omnitrophota bacterium]
MNLINNNFFKPAAVELKIPAKSEYMNVVRLAVAGIGERMGFSVDDIEDIKIAVAEACINSIRHGYQGKKSEENLVYMRFLIYPRKLKIVIKDEGGGFDTSRVGEYLKKADSDKIEGIGLGIYLIKTLMDEVQYSSSSKGTEVKMLKNK